MGSRKVNTEGIDEELLLASIGRRTQDGTLRPAQEVPAAAPTEEDTAAPEPSPVQPVTREKAQRESGRRKRQDEDYNELFLRRNEIKTLHLIHFFNFRIKLIEQILYVTITFDIFRVYFFRKIRLNRL